jgi:hypothetical protein
MPDQNWYHNPNSYNGPFPDSHVITNFKADTIIYEEPTIPPELRIEPRTENCAIHVLYIHHKNMPIGAATYSQQMNEATNTLQIPEMFSQIAPQTPTCIVVNRNTKWFKLTYPPTPPTTQNPTNIWTNNL